MTVGIGCSPITGRIFIGPSKKVNDTGTRIWTGSKIDITGQAVGAVAYHFHVKSRTEYGGGKVVVEGEHTDGTRFTLTYEEQKDTGESE